MKHHHFRRVLLPFLLASTVWTWAADAEAQSQGSRRPHSVVIGVPSRPTLVGELGWSGLPRIGLLYPISPELSVGGELILDLSLFNSLQSGVPGTVTFAVGAPIKYQLAAQGKLIMGMTLTPGLGVASRFGGASFALPLHSEFHAGYIVNPQVLVGGGVDMPITIYIGDASGVVIPVLIGPVGEFRLTPNLVLYTELKMGPHILAGDGSFVGFGFKFQVGAGFSF